MTKALIVSTARTPLGKSWKGAFNMTHGATLGGHAVKAAVERAEVGERARGALPALAEIILAAGIEFDVGRKHGAVLVEEAQQAAEMVEMAVAHHHGVDRLRLDAEQFDVAATLWNRRRRCSRRGFRARRFAWRRRGGRARRRRGGRRRLSFAALLRARFHGVTRPADSRSQVALFACAAVMSGVCCGLQRRLLLWRRRGWEVVGDRICKHLGKYSG